MGRKRLASCKVRANGRQEETKKLGKTCLFVGGPANCQRKECVVPFNDEDRSNSNSGKEAAQDPRRTSRRGPLRPRRQQHERLHHYSPQGIGCLFCCEKESMVVVLLVFTSNAETRMAVYCAVAPPETDGIQKTWLQFARCPFCRYIHKKSETLTAGYGIGFLFNSDVIRWKRSDFDRNSIQYSRHFSKSALLSINPFHTLHRDAVPTTTTTTTTTATTTTTTATKTTTATQTQTPELVVQR